MSTSTTKLLSKPIRTKLLEAVNFGYKNSKGKFPENFDRVECVMILSLFYGLLTRDIALYYFLQDVLSNIFKIESISHISWWLRNDFLFDNNDVTASLSFANYLAEKGELKLPQQVIAVFIGLHRRQHAYSELTSSQTFLFNTKSGETRLNAKYISIKERMVQQYKTQESTRTKWGKTPLHLAASMGDASAVRLLALHYRSVDPQDCDGWTPLHEAVNGLHFETVRILLDLGGSIEIRDSKGLSPFGLAGRKKSHAMLKLFEKHSDATKNGSRSPKPDLWRKKSIDINKRDTEGRTALHILAGLGMGEELGRFLILGADMNLKDKKGKSPFHHAVLSGDEATISLLTSANKISLKSAERKCYNYKDAKTIIRLSK